MLADLLGTLNSRVIMREQRFIAAEQPVADRGFYPLDRMGKWEARCRRQGWYSIRRYAKRPYV